MDARLKGKLDRIFESCKGVDKILIRNTSQQDPNFTYLTGFKSGTFEGDLLIVDRKGLVLYTSELEYTTALQQKLEGMKIIKMDDANVIRNLLTIALKDKKIGINGSFIPYSSCMRIKKRFKPSKLVDVTTSFSKVRLIKDHNEIENIAKAANITKKAMVEIQSSFKEGVTETDLARKFDTLLEALGSDGPSFNSSFNTIVCFGKNSASPHHLPESRTRLRPGDFVLIDSGALINNYHSDISRTFVFEKSRKDDYEEKSKMVDIVKSAQAKAIAGIRPGSSGKTVNEIAANYIDAAEKGRYKNFSFRLIHALGHSLGIEEHDGEGFGPNSKLTVKENMVFAVEPGIYIPGFGGVRMEDDIVVTKKGCRIL